MKAERHRCPIVGCAHSIDAGHLMCRIHWRHVSDKTRRAVTVTWRGFLKATRAPRGEDGIDQAARRLDVTGAREAYEAARKVALAEAARDPGAELAGRMSTDVVVDDFHTTSVMEPRHD